jgi:hypothetical protein
MRLTPHQKKQLKIVLVLLIGIPLASFAVYKGVQYVSLADDDPTPRDVLLSNVTMSSVTISWLTEKAVETYLVPVVNGTEQSPVSDRRGEGERKTHYVELTGLDPSTTYSFKILSDGQEYTNGVDKGYEFATAPVLEGTPTPNSASGTVTGDNVDDCIVYIFFKNKTAFPVSAGVPSNGGWLVDLSSMKQVENYEMIRVTDEDELVVLVRSESGMGAVLEGEYSSLFGSDGTLNRTLSLEIGESPGLLSYFPEESILGVNYEEPEPEPDPVDPDPVDPDPVDPDPIEPEPPVTGDPRIRNDVLWTGIPVNSTGSTGLDYGEDTVLITNITDTSFTVVWRSNQAQEGYVKYGTEKSDLSNELRDTRDNLTTMNPYVTHFVESDKIEPETTYYFEIYSGDEIYDNNGEKYSVTTFATLSSPPPLDIKDGSIVNGDNLSDWIVVFSVIDSDELGTQGSSTYVSALPDENGEWYITVGDTRNQEGTLYFSYSDSDILQAFVLGAQEKKFDFNLGATELEIDLSEVGSGISVGRVELLSDYGILKIK